MRPPVPAQLLIYNTRMHSCIAYTLPAHVQLLPVVQTLQLSDRKYIHKYVDLLFSSMGTKVNESGLLSRSESHEIVYTHCGIVFFYNKENSVGITFYHIDSSVGLCSVD